MGKSAGASGQEWGFLALLLVLCVVLAALQFRWTGELAKAEVERLGGKETELAQDFCSRFDRELSAACTVLAPESGPLDPEDITLRIRRWQTSSPRPLFRRIAIAKPVKGAIELTGFNLKSGDRSAMEWPESWAELKGNLAKKADGGSPPYADRTGLLIEFPMHARGGNRLSGGPPGRKPDGPRQGHREPPPGDEDGFPIDDGPGGPPPPDDDRGPGPEVHADGSGRETGWVILELDPAYLTGVWLPSLMAETLNPPGLEIHHARVVAEGSASLPVFESGPSGGRLEDEQRFSFNAQGRATGTRGARWILEVARIPNLLEQTVSASRQRNLLLAIGVTGLILTAGFLLVRQTRRARLLAQAQMDFVANVSHELRTPLTVIRGAAHNLKRGIVKDDAGVERYSGLILQHTDQLNEMVQQVLDFSSVSKSRLMEDRVAVDVGQVLREAFANTAADTRTCAVETQIEENLPFVSGDAAMLRRVFQNLLANAAKHGGSGEWIGVSAMRAEGGFIEVRIADRGPGILRSEQAEIFTPFYRGAAAREGQVRGSGLGLGLVKEIVAAHGGSVSVCSGEGGGATFVVRLPVQAPSE